MQMDSTVTTSNVHHIYEQYAIELTEADASALRDLANRERDPLDYLHGQAQMLRATFDDDTYERCRQFA